MDPTTIEEKVARLEALAAPEPVIPVEWEDEERPEVSTALAWRCDSERDANWCLGRRAELEAQIASIEAQARDAIDRIEARKAKLTERIQRGVGFFTYQIMRWAEQNKRSLLTGTKKSRDLINGRLAWRKKGGRLRVEDKAALVAWLETQPPESGLYRLKVEPEMTAIQAHFKAENVIPPGCVYEQEEDVLHVETTTEAIKKG